MKKYQIPSDSLRMIIQFSRNTCGKLSPQPQQQQQQQQQKQQQQEQALEHQDIYTYTLERTP